LVAGSITGVPVMPRGLMLESEQPVEVAGAPSVLRQTTMPSAALSALTSLRSVATITMSLPPGPFSKNSGCA
jgi:hypothetical protein